MKRNYKQRSLGYITALMFSTLTMAGTIVKTAPVSVEVPVGHAPRLPFQIWVTYDNGKNEYRQVRWNNYELATEQAEADTHKTPVGTEYQVEGFIVGDDTTPNGFPVTAHIKVTEQPWDTPSPIPVANTLPLDKVTVDGENRLTWNRSLDINNLLTIDVRQQLYNYLDTYGLPTEGYPTSDGWDSPTTKLKGHGVGHYMSALALAFASCQNNQQKVQLKENIIHI